MQLYRIYDKVRDRHLSSHYGATYWNSLSAVKGVINQAKQRREYWEARCKTDMVDPDVEPEHGGPRYWRRVPNPLVDWEVQVCDFMIKERLSPKWVSETVHKKQ